MAYAFLNVDAQCCIQLAQQSQLDDSASEMLPDYARQSGELEQNTVRSRAKTLDLFETIFIR